MENICYVYIIGTKTGAYKIGVASTAGPKLHHDLYISHAMDYPLTFMVLIRPGCTAVGGVLLQTCPGLPSRRQLSVLIHYTLSSLALVKAASASAVRPSALRATPLLFQVAATAA